MHRFCQQFARITLLAALAASLIVSPIVAMGGVNGEPMCIASMLGGDACCDKEAPAKEACCAKHAAMPAGPKAPVDHSDDAPRDSTPQCPCCVIVAHAPCGLPAAPDAPALDSGLVTESNQLPPLCHASAWVYCEFRPPSR